MKASPSNASCRIASSRWPMRRRASARSSRSESQPSKGSDVRDRGRRRGAGRAGGTYRVRGASHPGRPGRGSRCARGDVGEARELPRRSGWTGVSPRAQMEGRLAALHTQPHRASGSPLPRRRTRPGGGGLPPRSDPRPAKGLRAPIVVVALNRPDNLNAMSMMLKAEVVRALHDLDADEHTRTIVLTGSGDKAFTAGADIHEFQGRTAMEQWRMYDHGTLYDAIERTAKPILAMINGYCFGGGLELAMACDIRIASDRATLGQTEINIGIIPGGGGSQRLSRLVGLGNALKLTLTGDRIDATEALRMGLVDEVVPHARLEPRTFEIADRIASRSALAVRLAKAAVRASARMPLNQGLRYEQSLFTLVMSSEDKEEGVRAFLEKRDARWKDR